MRFKDSKMTRPKSVAHTQHSIPAAARGGMPTSSEQLPNQPMSQLPPKTNYPDPTTTAATDDHAFRERTDTANSVKFDISYDL